MIEYFTKVYDIIFNGYISGSSTIAREVEKREGGGKRTKWVGGACNVVCGGERRTVVMRVVAEWG